MMRTVMEEAGTEEGDLRKLFGDFSGELCFDAPMAPYTSLKIGGPADLIVFPASIPELAAVMEKITRHRLSFFVLGGGSNLLVKDGGLAGVVIHLKHFSRITLTGDSQIVAEGGVSYPKLSTYAMEKGLSGLEFAAGIPGTVGGAVAMNAGIPGEETASLLKEVVHVGLDGSVRTLDTQKLRFGYRSSALPSGVVASATFRLAAASVAQVETKLKALLKRRRETQPLSFPNVGSVFKNPKPAFAGALIEQAGLKGHRIGDAQVSEKHANFIVNRGKATAKEVIALIDEIREKVSERHGIVLEPEVKIVGRD